MGLKSAASGKGIVGKFTGQPLTALFSGGSSPPAPPSNGYVAEDGTTYYTAEDGLTYYVQEGGLGLSGQPIGLSLILTYA